MVLICQIVIMNRVRIVGKLVEFMAKDSHYGNNVGSKRVGGKGGSKAGNNINGTNDKGGINDSSGATARYMK